MSRAWPPFLSLALTCGCPATEPYRCEEPSDCDRTGGGICLPDSTCAYPEAEQCPSGFARSPNAAIDPNACVPDDGTAEPGPGCASVSVHVNPNLLSPTDLSGYPLLLRTDDPSLAESLEEGASTLRVTTASGDPLPFERVPSRARPSSFAVWVSLPEYEEGETLFIDLQWGGDLSSNNPLQVWGANYLAVWHLDDPLVGEGTDEASNAVSVLETALVGGNMQPTQAVAGVVGGGLKFDGIDDVLSVDAPFVGALDSFSISMWSRFDGDATTPQSSYFHRLNGEYLLPRCWRLKNETISCQYALSDEDTRSLGDSSKHPPGELVHLALIRDATAQTTTMVVNGQIVDTLDDPDLPLGSSDFPFEIGRGEWGSADAMIDEVRVSGAALPTGWMTADYLSQADPSFAVTFGEVQAEECS